MSDSVRITLLDKIWSQAGDRDWRLLEEDDVLLDRLGSAVHHNDLMAFGGDALAGVLLEARRVVDSEPFAPSTPVALGPPGDDDEPDEAETPGRAV